MDIQKIIDEEAKKRNLTASTKKIYLTNINRLIEANNLGDITSWNFLNSSKTEAKLEGYAPATLAQYYASILVFLGADPKKNKKLIKKFILLLDESNDKAKAGPRRKNAEDLPSWQDIIDLRDELGAEVEPLWSKKKPSPANMKKLQDYVIMCLYTMIPPRRNDYADMEIVRNGNEATTDNYLRVKSASKLTFYIDDYKTVKTNGEIVEQVKNPLLKVLKKWVTFDSNRYLLTGVNGKPMSANMITKTLLRITKNLSTPVSSGHLRIIYVSDKYEKVMSDIKKDAKSMGHSVETAIDAYIAD